MITEEHFETLRKVREEANKLRLVCIAAQGTAALLHIAFDSEIRQSEDDAELLGKLRSVQ